MRQKINAMFTKRVLELNGSLRFNDSLSSCNRAQVPRYAFKYASVQLLVNSFNGPSESNIPYIASFKI